MNVYKLYIRYIINYILYNKWKYAVYIYIQVSAVSLLFGIVNWAANAKKMYLFS